MRLLRHMRNADRFFLFVIALLALPSLLGPFQPTPLEYRNLPFPVSEVVVHAGDSLSITVERCNRTNDILTYTISRLLVNAKTGAKIQLSDSSSFMPPGCETIVSKVNVIPTGTDDGRYFVDAVSTARGNGRSYNIPWTTQPFTVVK